MFSTYLYFGPSTLFPRNFLDVRGIRPFAFKEAVAVNPIDFPALYRARTFLFFRVIRYPPNILDLHGQAISNIELEDVRDT
jgi:hypothetical protein